MRPLTINSKNHIFLHTKLSKYDYSLVGHHVRHKVSRKNFSFIDGWFGKFAILFRQSTHKRTILVDDYQEKNLTNDICGCHAFEHVGVDRCEGIYFNGTWIENGCVQLTQPI